MLNEYVRRFDVMGNVEKFLGTKHGLIILHILQNYVCFFIKAQVNAHATNIILRQEVKILCQMYALTIGIQKITKDGIII